MAPRPGFTDSIAGLRHGGWDMNVHRLSTDDVTRPE